MAQVTGYLNDILHGTANYADLAVIVYGCGYDLLDAVDIAGEGGDDDTPSGLFDDVVNRLGNDLQRCETSD